MTTSKKTCFKCEIEQPLVEFYRHKMMKDGHLNKCKICAIRDSKRNRSDRIDYYLNYDRRRGNLPKRVAARHKYMQTIQGKNAAEKGRRRWNKKNPIKLLAIRNVQKAIKKGLLKKPNHCQSCNITDVRIIGHHDDYSNSLDVRWLCSKCHRDWHKNNGAGKSGI